MRKTGEKRERQPVQVLEEGSGLRQPALEEGSRLRQLTVRDEEGRPGPASQQTMGLAPGPRESDKENRIPSSWPGKDKMLPAPRPASGPGEAGKENIQLSSWRRSLRPQGKAIRLKRVDLEKGTTGPANAAARTTATTPLKLRDMNRI
jgi:hypothetical protein